MESWGSVGVRFRAAHLRLRPHARLRDGWWVPCQMLLQPTVSPDSKLIMKEETDQHSGDKGDGKGRPMLRSQCRLREPFCYSDSDPWATQTWACHGRVFSHQQSPDEQLL